MGKITGEIEVAFLGGNNWWVTWGGPDFAFALAHSIVRCTCPLSGAKYEVLGRTPVLTPVFSFHQAVPSYPARVSRPDRHVDLDLARPASSPVHASS